MAVVAGLAVFGALVFSGRHPQAPHVVPSPASRQTAVVDRAQSQLARSLSANAWADRTTSPFRATGASVLLVKGVGVRAALARLVPRPTESRETLRSVAAWAKRMSTDSLACETIAASKAGSWTRVVELGGSQVMTPGAVAGLSRRATVVSVSEDDELDAAFLVARAGHIVRRFDPVLGTSLVGTPLAAERDIEFGVRTSLSAMARSLVVVERLTGVHLSRADLIGSPDAESVGYCS